MTTIRADSDGRQRCGQKTDKRRDPFFSAFETNDSSSNRSPGPSEKGGAGAGTGTGTVGKVEQGESI